MKLFIKTSILLLALLMPVTVLANDFEVDGIYYNLTDDNTVEVTYKGTYYLSAAYTGDVVIPASVTNNGTTYSVTSIGDWAFYSCKRLTSVTIPNSVTSLGMNAIKDCSSLTSLTIPNSVTSFELNTFGGNYNMTHITVAADNPKYDSRENCNAIIETATNTLVVGCTGSSIPNTITAIGEQAFMRSGITDIVIPNSVIDIGKSAFYKSDLRSISIGNSVTNFGDYALEECTNLTNMTVAADNPVYDSRENCNAIIKTANNMLILGCQNSIIPNSITNIGERAFYNCENLAAIIIPNSVTTISALAFSGCSSLTSITIPITVTSIGQSSFTRCSNLTSITIPESIKSIGNNAFYGCNNLKTLNFNATNCNNFGKEDNSPFYNSGIMTINIGVGVQRIPQYLAYKLDSLKEVTISESVTEIATYAFYSCSAFTTLNFNAANCADFNSYLYAPAPFSYCGITTVNFGNTVKRIPNSFVRGMNNLTEITIGSSVTEIGPAAFTVNGKVNSISVAADNPVFDSRDQCNAVIETATNTLIAACIGSTIPNSVTAIGDYAFNECIGLRDVTIPNSVTTIGECAFYDCIDLTSITIPESVTFFGLYAFSNCKKMTEAIIGNSITTISARAFYDCQALTKVQIGNAVTVIDNSAFENCTNLTDLSFGSAVTHIGVCAFQRCKGLTEISIPKSVTDIDQNAFRYCDKLSRVDISDLTAWCNINFGFGYSNPIIYAQHLYLNGSELTNLIIPESVNSIKNYAFQNCLSLRNVTIPNTVTTIGDRSFLDCSMITELSIGNSVTSMGPYAFANCTSLNTLYYNAKECANFTTNNLPFSNCNLTTIYIGDEVEKIPNYLSYDMPSLTHLTIGNAVKSIGSYSFYNCNSLTSVTFPQSVTFINTCAFSGCSALTSVTIPRNVTSINSKAFYGCTAMDTLQFNAVHCSSYGSPFSGNNLTKIFIGDEVEYIPANFAHQMTSLSSITIPDAVVTIDSEAFSECTNLTDVITSPLSSVSTIKAYAFKNCSSLKNIPSFPHLTDLGKYAFNGCTGLTGTVTLPAIAFIDGFAFKNCTEITEFVLGDSLKTINDDAFSDCKGLIKINIPASVTYIGIKAFNNDSTLTDVYCYAPDPSTITMGTYTTSVLYLYPFYGTNYNSLTLHVPHGSVDLYKANSIWYRSFRYFVEMDNGGGSAHGGDINGDGETNINDVTDLIDLLLSGNTEGNAYADVDGDGEVTINDLTVLIDKLLTRGE